MSEKCEICGGNVEVIGNTTKSYKNLDKEIIDKQKQALDKAVEVLKDIDSKYDLYCNNCLQDTLKEIEEILK